MRRVVLALAVAAAAVDGFRIPPALRRPLQQQPSPQPWWGAAAMAGSAGSRPRLLPACFAVPPPDGGYEGAAVQQEEEGRQQQQPSAASEEEGEGAVLMSRPQGSAAALEGDKQALGDLFQLWKRRLWCVKSASHHHPTTQPIDGPIHRPPPPHTTDNNRTKADYLHSHAVSGAAFMGLGALYVLYFLGDEVFNPTRRWPTPRKGVVGWVPLAIMWTGVVNCLSLPPHEQVQQGGYDTKGAGFKGLGIGMTMLGIWTAFFFSGHYPAVVGACVRACVCGGACVRACVRGLPSFLRGGLIDRENQSRSGPRVAPSHHH